MKQRTFGALHLCCGIGGLALGAQRARSKYAGIAGRIETLLGVDNDPLACADFTRLTGAPSLQADLATLTPEQLRAACPRAPDVVFSSPPCKGFSGLLPKARASEEKYQALNRLVFQGIWLVLETWRANPPALIVIENVPRIRQRGGELLRQVRDLLARYGYVTHEGLHDCGEIGGLAQRRKRFLLVARHVEKVPAFVYRPPIRRVRAIGEVLGKLPLPDHPDCGPMHRLPRIEWRTWVRLALIPAGGDWRALGTVDSEPYRGAYGVVPWDRPLGTVTGNGRPAAGAFNVADPRSQSATARYNNIYRVVRWDEPSVSITGGGGPSSGGVNVADPRMSNRPNRHESKYRVERWDAPAHTVTGSDRLGSGAPSVADPRITMTSRNDLLGVLSWNQPAKTISGNASVTSSNCPSAVADPRVDEYVPRLEIAVDHLPDDRDRLDPPPLIVAADGTWHRPLTTLELAALQSLEVIRTDGPLVLAGKSHERWREAIGNMVPPDAAEAMSVQILRALCAAAAGATFTLGMTDVWVDRYDDACDLKIDQERA